MRMPWYSKELVQLTVFFVFVEVKVDMTAVVVGAGRLC